MKALSLILSVAALLAGCASTPVDPLTGGYGTCTTPVTRSAGMGTTQPSCSAWTFGPSRTQARAFERHDGPVMSTVPR